MPVEVSGSLQPTDQPPGELGSTKGAVPSPTMLLSRLRDLTISDDERRTLIIEAEAIRFEPEQSRDLGLVLRTFIDKYRDSGDPQDIVAVASAIRKYVATMQPGDLSHVAELLDAGHKASVPLDLELEICKMVLRKLVASPGDGIDQFPELESRLAEIVRTYANDRLLPREKYGATTLNAVLALVMLDDGRIPGVVDQLRPLKAAWFRQLVARQAGKTAAEIRREVGGRAALSAGRLEALAAAFPQTNGGEDASTASQR